MKLEKQSDKEREWLRHRELQLDRPCSETLLQQLSETDGVIQAQQGQGQRLLISYNLELTSLYHLEKIIRSADVKLNQDLVHSLRHACYRYTEHIQRKNQVLDTGWDIWVRDVYLSYYRNNQHGRRDARVQQWRKYVKD